MFRDVPGCSGVPGFSTCRFSLALSNSTKGWLDFQLLNAGSGTEVIVVFDPLSSSYV